MFDKLAILLIATASLIAQNGQGPTSIRHHYKPGDTLHYSVTFESDPSFDGLSIYFQGGPVAPDQSGLANGFTLPRSKKVAAGTFEVEGEIPINAASGTYRLSSVETRISPSGAKGYDAGEFHETVEIDNGAKYEFPPLKSVVPK
jgi:hypothetical protein